MVKEKLTAGGQIANVLKQGFIRGSSDDTSNTFSFEWPELHLLTILLT
jgi:hypothetical protein